MQPVGLHTTGFVFSPFDHGNHAFVLVPSLRFEDAQLRASTADPRGEAFMRELRHHAGAAPFYPAPAGNTEASKEDYTALVDESVGAIRSGQYRKLVAARCATRPLRHFDLAHYFLQLCETYPQAFVYTYASPDNGTWVGATPEHLIAVEQNTLRTVALAGTIARNSGQQWTDKEREEQAHVADFIAAVFAEAGIRDYYKGAVETIAAGELMHLVSSFSWQADEALLHTHFASLLAALNPTPAVCGLPKKEAAAFLEAHEGFKRRFYSGFAGMIDQGSAQLFVNLRCMELLQQEAILYAGAGLTAASVAEKEWQETERKMQTLGTLL